jgi:hypothetical protein
LRSAATPTHADAFVCYARLLMGFRDFSSSGLTVLAALSLAGCLSTSTGESDASQLPPSVGATSSSLAEATVAKPRPQAAGLAPAERVGKNGIKDRVEEWREHCRPIVDQCILDTWEARSSASGKGGFPKARPITPNKKDAVPDTIPATDHAYSSDGYGHVTTGQVSSCAADVDPACRYATVCPEDGFLDIVYKEFEAFRGLYDEVFRCDGGRITVAPLTAMPEGGTDTWRGTISTENGETWHLYPEGDHGTLLTMSPSCTGGDHELGCHIPMGTNGLDYTTYCPDDVSTPNAVSEGFVFLPGLNGELYTCPGEFYFESDDGRCWNIPCNFQFISYVIFDPACELKFTGDPHEVPCNPNCEWDDRGWCENADTAACLDCLETIDILPPTD